VRLLLCLLLSLLLSLLWQRLFLRLPLLLLPLCALALRLAPVAAIFDILPTVLPLCSLYNKLHNKQPVADRAGR
jgi:hypothetical protein